MHNFDILSWDDKTVHAQLHIELRTLKRADELHLDKFANMDNQASIQTDLVITEQ